MASIGKISLQGFVSQDEIYTFLVKTGAAEAVIADVMVKAVSLDTATNNQVKLATDGERILGMLASYEDRTAVEGITVGAVVTEGGLKFLVNPEASTSPDERPAVGDYIVGDVTTTGTKAGYVRKATSAEINAGKSNWQVVEADTAHTYVIAISV